MSCVLVSEGEGSLDRSVFHREINERRSKERIPMPMTTNKSQIAEIAVANLNLFATLPPRDMRPLIRLQSQDWQLRQGRII